MRYISVTVDVESDWGGRLSVSRTNCIGIEKGIPWLLSLFNHKQIKTTFFVSSSILNLYSELVKEIKLRGHEIASHGYQHMDYSNLSENDLLYQVKKSKELLENSLNCKIEGFRAPQFRIHPDLHKVLFISGYKYDSTYVCCASLRGRYNYSRVNRALFRTNYNVLEVPITNIPYTNKPMGLLWINHLSFSIFSVLDRLSKYKRDIVFYLHPFDILDKKSKNNFGFLVDFWYSFRAQHAFNTLQQFIEYYSRCHQFVSLNEYLKENT